MLMLLVIVFLFGCDTPNTNNASSNKETIELEYKSDSEVVNTILQQFQKKGVAFSKDQIEKIENIVEKEGLSSSQNMEEMSVIRKTLRRYLFSEVLNDEQKETYMKNRKKARERKRKKNK